MKFSLVKPTKEPDWTQLPYDMAIEVLSCLNRCDRASLASTCWSWKRLGSSPFLWHSLDLRFCKLDSIKAFSLLSPYCVDLQKLRFCGDYFINDIILNLQARNLREVKGYTKWGSHIGHSLSAVSNQHPSLECLELDYSFRLTEREVLVEITSCEEIQVVPLCCPNLRKLKLSQFDGINGDAIDSLSMHCRNLSEIRLMDCSGIDVVALGKVSSLRFLSVAGTDNINWNSVCDCWTKLPNLIGLDLSRTNVHSDIISRFLSLSSCLKILCALECPALVLHENANNKRSTKFVANYPQVCRILIPNANREYSKKKENNVDEMMTWLEYITCHVLFRKSEYEFVAPSDFWLAIGGFVLHFMVSPQEDVQEMILRVLAELKFHDNMDTYGNNSNCGKILCVLMELAKSKHEGLQLGATKAIINLCGYPSNWKSFVNQGGVATLMNLIRSSIKQVAEEAAKKLSVLSDKKEYKEAIIEAGCTETLLDLITKRSKFGLKHMTSALANIATDERCGRKIARVGGLHALVKLGFEFRNDRIINQVSLAIANLFGNTDFHKDPVGIEELRDIVKELNQLTYCRNDVRGKAVAALLKLYDDDEFIKAFTAANAIEALISQQRVSTSSEENPCTSSWKLPVLKANSIIGQEGRATSLVALANSNDAKVRDNAVKDLENLVGYTQNILALQRDVVSALVGVCGTTKSDSPRFTYTLALAYMIDGRLENEENVGRRKSKRTGVQKEVRKIILDQISIFILTFFDRRNFSTSLSMPLPYLLETLVITDASYTCCSEPKLQSLLTMLKDRSFVLVAFAAFAIFQFTSSNGIHFKYQRKLVENAGGIEIMRDKVSSKSSHDIVKVLCRLVLMNLNA